MEPSQELSQIPNLTKYLNPEEVFLRKNDYSFGILEKTLSVTVNKTHDVIAGFPGENNKLSYLAYIPGATVQDMKHRTAHVFVPGSILHEEQPQEFGVITFNDKGGTLMSDGVIVATVENQSLKDAQNQEIGVCTRFPKDTPFLPNGKLTIHEQEKLTRAYMGAYTAWWVYENILNASQSD